MGVTSPIVDVSCEKISGRSAEQFWRSCPQNRKLKKTEEKNNNNNNTHAKTNGTITIRFPLRGNLNNTHAKTNSTKTIRFP